MYTRKHTPHVRTSLQQLDKRGIYCSFGTSSLPRPIQNLVDLLDNTRIGYKVHFEWQFPEQMLMADEVGHTTNMSRDRVSAADKAVCKVGINPQRPASTDDTHFNFICLNTMEGVPVLMVVIVTDSYKMNVNVGLGANVSQPWIGDRSCFEGGGFTAASICENTGKGKRHPGGVITVFNGKEILMLVLQSPKGSNSGPLLRKIFKYLDDLEVFPQKPGLPPPSILLNAHGSQFVLRSFNIYY